MTLSSRAQAFSVDNLLRSSRHATHEVQPTAPTDGHLEKAREDDVVSCDGTSHDDNLRKERNGVKTKSHDRKGCEDKKDISGIQHSEHKVAESVSSCFCHGDLTFCYHPAVLSVKDESGQSGNSITAELLHADLWSSFHRLGTEMIITKSGRRMFPALKLRITGLNTEKNYTTRLEFVQPDFSKYRYIYPSSRWMISGTGDTMTSVPSHVTLECPTGGHVINSQVLSFERLKLTNSEQRKSGQVSLVSMQKFQPKVVIQEDVGFISRKTERYVIVFPQTSFMAVTAYQNQQITTLKIASNPFAKGFRESGKVRYPEALASQPPYFTAESLPMASVPTILQAHSHTPPSFLAVSDVRIGNKRPLPSPLTNFDDENPAAKLSRLAESRRNSKETTPPVIYPTSFISNGQPPLQLSTSHLQHLQQLADPTSYLRSPYHTYATSMKDAYDLPGRSYTPTRYANVQMANPSPSPTPIAVSVANRQHCESVIFSDDRLPIQNQSIRNRLLDGDAAPALGQFSTISPMPQSRPSSTSSKDRLSADIIAKNENHYRALRHLKRESELIAQSDDRRHFPRQFYHPTSPSSVNTPNDLKGHIIPESIANGYECAPMSSLLSQRLSGKFNVLSESLHSCSQFQWRPFPLTDVSKCLTPHMYNDTMPRNFSQFEQRQASCIFQGHHRLMELPDRQGPMIDARTLFRCVDEENVKPSGSVTMHDGPSRSAYSSMQPSKDINDRLLMIH